MSEYSIKEISDKYNLPHSTLHYYEEIGLLENVERNKSGRRIYNDCHICRLDAIICFKNTGMSISDIKKFFMYEKNLETHIDEITYLMEKHNKNIQNKIQMLLSEQEHIQRKVNYYNGIKKAVENKSYSSQRSCEE